MSIESAALSRASLAGRVRAVIGRRRLLGVLARREVQVRYKQALLGALWAVFLPLALMLVFTQLRKGLGGSFDAGVPYRLWAYAGLAAWTMHQTALKGCTGVLVTNRNLIQKVWFPRELLPLSKVAAALVDFGVALGLLGVLMAVEGVAPTAATALLPLVVLVHVMLVVGVGLFLAAANVFFRDVQYVFDVAVLVWMFASPVFVGTAGRVRVGGIDVLRDLNPLHPILEGYRDVLFRGGLTDPLHFAQGAAMALAALLAGWFVFARAEPRFAERA
ncbi:MAG: Teichoic acid translocation permease protein TagG [Planctomycetes bacterium]|nr:Teichoic acid translocation permease protein TagG [Planctomycetota bacterium]